MSLKLYITTFDYYAKTPPDRQKADMAIAVLEASMGAYFAWYYDDELDTYFFTINCEDYAQTAAEAEAELMNDINQVLMQKVIDSGSIQWLKKLGNVDVAELVNNIVTVDMGEI